MLLRPNGALDGMMLLHGTRAQLDAVMQDERFERLTIDASLVVDELRVLDGYANTGIAEPMGRFQDALAQLPQVAHA